MKQSYHKPFLTFEDAELRGYIHQHGDSLLGGWHKRWAHTVANRLCFYASIIYETYYFLLFILDHTCTLHSPHHHSSFIIGSNESDFKNYVSGWEVKALHLRPAHRRYPGKFEFEFEFLTNSQPQIFTVDKKEHALYWFYGLQESFLSQAAVRASTIHDSLQPSKSEHLPGRASQKCWKGMTELSRHEKEPIFDQKHFSLGQVQLIPYVRSFTYQEAILRRMPSTNLLLSDCCFFFFFFFF